MLEKIIDSFEKLCVQIIIEVILVPITIYKLFRKSSRCFDYVSVEMKKEDGARFLDILSPIKLSVYTSVIISVLMIEYGGQQSFLSKISGLNLVEKALILFMMNNFTAILFSLFLLRHNRQKVNSQEFRSLLFSFIYTSVYITVPQFILILSMMAIGQTININAFIKEMDAVWASDALSVKPMLLLFAFAVSFILMMIGLVKLFNSYQYILKNNLRHSRFVIYAWTVCFFILQIGYILLVLK